LNTKGDIGFSLLFQGMEGGHQNATGLGLSIGLRAEADFASNDRGPEISLSQIVICRNAPVFGPPIHPIRIVIKDFLDATDGQMMSGSMNHLNEL